MTRAGARHGVVYLSFYRSPDGVTGHCPALVTLRHQGEADSTDTAAGGEGTVKNARTMPVPEMTVAKTRATRTPRRNWGSALREDINSLLLAPEPPLLLSDKPCLHGNPLLSVEPLSPKCARLPERYSSHIRPVQHPGTGTFPRSMPGAGVFGTR